MTDGQNMRHGSDFFLLDGQYLTDEGRSESVVCAFARKGGKTLKRNGKEYERLSDHVGLIPVVIVSPADTMLISDAADERRRYLNGFISQLDRAYLQALVRYNAVLGERNRLLKISRDEQMLCIYDRQLVEQGGIIHRKRSEIRSSARTRSRPILPPPLQRPRTGDARIPLGAERHPLRRVAAQVPGKGFRQRIHHCGHPPRRPGTPHRRLSPAQIRFAGTAKIVSDRSQTRPICPGRPSQREKPILLLDDLFDKLDAGRVEQLIRLVGDDGFGQIFITDCNPTRLRTILDKTGDDYSLFTVENGGIVR